MCFLVIPGIFRPDRPCLELLDFELMPTAVGKKGVCISFRVTLLSAREDVWEWGSQKGPFGSLRNEDSQISREK